MASRSKLGDLLTAAGVTVGLGGAGAWLGPMIGLPAGGTAVLCGLPTAVAASVVGRRIAGVAALSLAFVAAVGLWRDVGRGSAIGGSAVAIASAGAALALAGKRRRHHEDMAFGLERLNHRILADVARRPEPSVEPSPSEQDVIGAATSLLSLQEAGRRIATHLDLDTLVPTVITMARSALKCREASVYFWDSRTRTLSAALPHRSRDANRYAPDPTKGVTKWVISTRQVYTAIAAQTHPELASLAAEDGRWPAGVAPLLAGNELLGVLVVEDQERPDPSFARMLYILANLAALGIKNAQLFRRVEDSARRDPLTGLLNRGAFELSAEELLEGAGEEKPVTVLLSDLDHFKRLNDEHGHQAGDAVLREAARLWRAALPEDAVVARYGGEEFLAVLPGCDLERGRELAEGLREALAGHPFTHSGTPLSVTASFGLAEYGKPAKDLDGLLRRADELMYRAKAEGRNRVCVAAGVEA
jgi:two-component system, cell cycle response regulator